MLSLVMMMYHFFLFFHIYTEITRCFIKIWSIQIAFIFKCLRKCMRLERAIKFLFQYICELINVQLFLFVFKFT